MVTPESPVLAELKVMGVEKKVVFVGVGSPVAQIEVWVAGAPYVNLEGNFEN